MPKNKGWFRFYDRAIDNPDIIALDSETYRLLTSLWVIASTEGNNGSISHSAETLQIRLGRWTKEALEKMLLTLINGDLLQKISEIKYKIPRWEIHQYGYKSRIPRQRKTRGWDNLEQKEREANGKLTVNQREANGKVDTDTDTDKTPFAVSDEKPIAQPIPLPLKIEFSSKDKEFKNILPEDKEKWSKAYPALNVNQELLAMEVWVMANPKNRKSNWHKFIAGWLSRSQDRAPGTKKITWKDIEAREKELERKKREDNKPIPALAPTVKEIKTGQTMKYEKKVEDCTNPKKAECKSPYCAATCRFRGKLGGVANLA